MLAQSKAFGALLGLFLATSGAFAQENPTPPEGMVFVPAGEFIMGTNDRDSTDHNQRDNVPLSNNDARPRHTARTGAFFMDKTEVTNAQYARFCQAARFPTPPHWIGGQIPANRENHPVTHVSFYDAQAFARWAGKRLPTEFEWEKTARGTDGRLFPWGDEWRGERAVTESGTQPVGSRPAGASPYGALDMAGNVYEWTSSWFEPYPNAPTQQPDFGQKTMKVVRGGSFTGGSDLARTWFRSVFRPRARSPYVGFRCAKDAP